MATFEHLSQIGFRKRPLSVYSILISYYGSKTSVATFLWFIISHTRHGIWDWCNNLVMSWLMSVNYLLILCLDNKLISIAHFIQAIKVNIVPSQTYSPIFFKLCMYIFQPRSLGSSRVSTSPAMTKIEVTKNRVDKKSRLGQHGFLQSGFLRYL